MGWKQTREKLKENKYIHGSVKKVKELYFFHIKKEIQEANGLYRAIFHPTMYKRLSEFKNIHKGQRCFIVCTGPSLTFQDLELIKNEYSFGMNSILRIYDKTSWRPTYYGIQDKLVYEKMASDVNATEQTMFVSDEIVKTGLPVPKNVIIFPLNLFGHEYFNFKHPKFKFSTDVCANVYDGFSITYSLMQIAHYMGFTEIYLLGCDCSYAKDPEKQHFVASGHIDPNASLVGGLQSQAYKKAKEFCDSHNMKIYNATRGGYLEIFERVKLEEAINDKDSIKK